MGETLSADFDLDKYLRASKKVDLSGVAWSKIKGHPLSVAEARTLAYMMDIESHTVISPYPTRNGRNAWIRRRLGSKGYLSHLATLGAAALMRDFVGLHMTWGAVNELSTLSGYHRMIDKTEHPVLVELLERIIKDERRFAFYRSHARMRLGRSGQARRVTRWALQHLWAPVGTGVRPQRETDFAVTDVFGDEKGKAAADQMDATIGELPGLEGIHIYRDALSEAMGRVNSLPSGRMTTPLAAFRA
jgi:hypothetical protein